MKINILVLLFLNAVICYNYSQNHTYSADALRIKRDLNAITKTDLPRNYKNIETLNNVAAYLKKEFKKVCDSTAYQTYNVYGREYKNVLGSIGIEHKERIIIGAHYDAYGNSEGADDNASGVAGLLELARLLSAQEINYRIDFVAYTLEEPPFFRTEHMGSYKHAVHLFKHQIPVKGMICLETIGYYTDKPNTQEYPLRGMELIYGTTGDFITLVQNEKKSEFCDKIEKLMKAQPLVKTKSFRGSSLVPGVDFSDHLNYWKFNYDAVLITNTAFYRNKNYHKITDELETLDINMISKLITQLANTVKQIE